MKNLLFIDDDADILNGLRRTLRARHNVWHQQYANSGETACTLLNSTRFDVIVSDMRMPGMDGRQFMKIARQQQPHAIRLMLSGYADDAALFESAGLVHQFIAKPCDPGDVITAIDRALGLRDQINAYQKELSVIAIDRLPIIPEVYRKLTSYLESPDACIAGVAPIVASDPALYADILKMSNSAFFGARQPIATIERACNFLGIDRLRGLALRSAFVTAHPTIFAADGPLAGWVEHSLGVAQLVRSLAVVHGFSQATIDQAFVAGMVHDVGLIVLAMAPWPDGGVPAPSILANLQTHGMLGAYLLGLWGFPDSIVGAVAWHHDPASLVEGAFGLPQVLYLADCFADDFAVNLAAESRGAPEGDRIDAVFKGRDDFAERWAQSAPLLEKLETGLALPA